MHHFLKKGYVLLEQKETEKKSEVQITSDKESSGGLMA